MGVVIGNAIVWAAVVFATAVVLRESGYFGRMIPVVGGGAAASVLVVGGGVRRLTT